MTNSQRTVFVINIGARSPLAENAQAYTSRESPLQEAPRSNVDLPGLSRCQGRTDFSSKHDIGGENRSSTESGQRPLEALSTKK